MVVSCFLRAISHLFQFVTFPTAQPSVSSEVARDAQCVDCLSCQELVELLEYLEVYYLDYVGDESGGDDEGDDDLPPLIFRGGEYLL